MHVERLTAEQLQNAVGRRGGDIPRIPFFWHKTYNPGTEERHGDALVRINESVVDDVVNLYWTPPGDFAAPAAFPSDYYWAVEDAPPGLRRKTAPPVLTQAQSNAHKSLMPQRQVGSVDCCDN